MAVSTIEMSPKVLIIDCGEITTLPVIVNDSRIKENHAVIGVDASHAYGIVGDWTVSTSNGSLTITGLSVAHAVTIKL